MINLQIAIQSFEISTIYDFLLGLNLSADTPASGGESRTHYATWGEDPKFKFIK
jgi:hypothetical protein